MKKLILILSLFILALPQASCNNSKKTRAVQPIRIVCVGNSITAGYGSTSEETAWPALANKLLGKQYAVYNCAVSGTTMFKRSDAPYWSTNRFAKAKSLNPQILIISLGTNDADPWRWKSLKNEFKSDYLDLIKEFRQEGKDPIIYICLPPPLFGPDKAPQNKVVEKELIPLLKEIGREIGAYIIDYHQPLLHADKEFPDNVHPDDAGAALMAQIAYENIKNAQIIKPRISVGKRRTTHGTVAVIEKGATVTLAPEAKEGTWTWIGPNGFSSTNKVVTLKDVEKGGTYTVVFTNKKGQKSIINFLVSIKDCNADSITGSIKDKNGEWQKTNKLSTNPGTNIVLSPQTKSTEGTWSWSGPGGFFAYTPEILLETLTSAKAGKYTATYTDKNGNQSWLDFFISVEGELICPNTISYININGKWEQTNVLEVKEGQNITLGPHPFNGQWTWKGPNGFTANRREATISKFNRQKAGDYIGTFTNAAGCKVELIVTLKLSK